MDSPGRKYTISGVNVQFPCNAYPTQIAMMAKILQGLEREQNCLLESPTGSGKSLALLCSCLAWQAAEYEKLRLEEEEEETCGKKEEENCGCPCHSGLQTGASNNPEEQSTSKYFPTVSDPAVVVQSPVQLDHDYTCTAGARPSISPNEDDFQPAKKKFRTPGGGMQSSRIRGIVYEDDGGTPNTPPTPAQWKMELTNNTSTNQVLCTCNCGNKGEERKEETEERHRRKKRAPKIFFGTRTHKQIAQITRELGKTAYKGTRMTILSSREHTCINSSIRGNKNDGCRELLDHKACSFHHNVVRMANQAQIQYKGLYAWDIEELVKLGKKIKSCPYYAARELMLEADIVFCPYNYLVDPVIRENMQISLKNNVIVLDEAHNIEDSAREAASFSMTEDQLDATMSELENLVLHNVKMDDHRALHIVCGSFKKWIKDSSSLLKDRDYERQTKVQTGMDMVAVLNSMGINPDTFGLLKKNLSAVTDPENKPEQKKGQEQQQMLWLGSASAQMLKGMFFVLGFLFKQDMKFAEDYRVVIERTVEYSNRPEHFPNGYVRMKKGRGMDKTFSHHLHFWCLNPAVAFSELANCRAIVLSSGTLSPIDSFQSELGVPFPIQLEANHVVGKKQVWVGTVGAGPRGRKLMATYQHTETYEFQDELGQLVLQVCQTISHGVLCFLPSYKLLGKLCQRWQMTRLWEQIEEHKQVIREPQGGDKADFDDILRQFYDAIKCSEDTENGGGHGGALFLAVCRGKVSEGLDFADNNARAVITVGIPYPNFKDLQVELKQNYNNQHSGARGLLTGRQWYEIQAYRALNQALGRCIRHKQDWGALILVDDRFSRGQGRYTKGLSKWVRQRVQHFNAFGSVVSSLTEFSTQMTEGSATSLDDSVAMPTGMTPQASPHPSHHSFLDTSVSTPDPQPAKLNAFQHLMGQSPVLDQTKRQGDTTPAVNKYEPQGFIPSTPSNVTGPGDQEKNISQDVSLSDRKASLISKGKLKALFKKNVQQKPVSDSVPEASMGIAHQVKGESSEVKGNGFMTPGGDNNSCDKRTLLGAIPTPKGRLTFEEDNGPTDTKEDVMKQRQRSAKGEVEGKGHGSKRLSMASKLAQFAYKSKEDSNTATEDAEIAGLLTKSCKKEKEENPQDQSETKDSFNHSFQDRANQSSGPNDAKVNSLFKFVNIGPLTTPVHSGSTVQLRSGMSTPPLQEASTANMDFTPPLFDSEPTTAEQNTFESNVENVLPQKGSLNDNDENEYKEDNPPLSSTRQRKRQLSSSAKKSTEKRRNSGSEKKSAAEKQSNKKKLFKTSQDENEGQVLEESQPALKIRRSFRSRRKANCPVLSEDYTGDFLDDLTTQSKEGKQAQGPCRPGLHCTMCGTELVSSVEDVHVEKETSTYIQQESKTLSNLRRRQSEGMKCQCNAPQMKEGRSHPTHEGMVLIDRARLEGKVQPMSPQKSAKGPHVNSFLSEEDQCLYVPVVCAGCKTKSSSDKTILGFNIISLGNGKPTTKGWLYYKALWHCPHLQLTE
ncbi:Fanconi anemia group J protein homolog [Branchiostoma floridae x Branchiostoma belcheri]